MTPDEVALYRPIVSCSLAHDGRRVAIAAPRHDPARDARPLEVLVRDLDGGGRWRRLDPGPAGRALYGPCLSPDGRRLLAFRATDGEAEAVCFDLEADPPAAETFHDLPARAAAFKWRGLPGTPSCLADDATGLRRAWAWPAIGEPPVPLTPAGHHVGDFAWSPDGERLAWVEIPTLDDPAAERLPVHVGRPGSGEPHRTLRVPGRPVGYLAWSPDGRWLAYMARLAGHRLSAARLRVVDPARWPDDPAAARTLTEGLDGWITGFDWLPGADALLVAVDQGTYGRLYRVGVDGAREPVGSRRSYLSAPHADRAGGRVAHLVQDGDAPQRLVLRVPSGGAPRVLTRWHEDLEARGLARCETLTWRAVDGLALDGVLVRPDGDGPAPLLVWLHGGPAEAVTRTFSPYFQAFAAAGWAVLAPNYRGSTGRDDAFLRANAGDLGGADADDVLSGIDRLVQQGVADPERTALVGWSYGGTLALHVARRSAVPRALVVGAPVVDWVAFFGAPRLPAVYQEYFPAALWEDRAPFDRASPITWLRDVDVPTLVLQGGADPVVPASQARLLYRALKARGIPTDLMIYPGEGHVLSRPSAVADMLRRILRWCGTHVGVAVPEDATQDDAG